jgi:hypothetical protein
MVVGYLQHRTVARLLTPEEGRQRPRWALSITATGAVASLLLSALIVAST